MNRGPTVESGLPVLLQNKQQGHNSLDLGHPLFARQYFGFFALFCFVFKLARVSMFL